MALRDDLDSRMGGRFARLKLDRMGIALSGACAVHCIASIALVGALGIGGGFLLAPGIHEVGLVLAILVGMATIGLGALRHGRRLPLGIGAGGLALMALAVAGPHGPGEALLTIAGVVLVASAHVLNLRSCAAPR